MAQKPGAKTAAKIGGAAIGVAGGFYTGRALGTKFVRAKCRKLHPNDPAKYKDCVYQHLKRFGEKYAKKKTD